ncbi:hypothetical protein PMIN04_012936 [Paraphaeosphaeria minitans]
MKSDEAVDWTRQTDGECFASTPDLRYQPKFAKDPGIGQFQRSCAYGADKHPSILVPIQINLRYMCSSAIGADSGPRAHVEESRFHGRVEYSSDDRTSPADLRSVTPIGPEPSVVSTHY